MPGSRTSLSPSPPPPAMASPSAARVPAALVLGLLLTHLGCVCSRQEDVPQTVSSLRGPRSLSSAAGVISAAQTWSHRRFLTAKKPPPMKKGAAVGKKPPPPKKGAAVKNKPPPKKKGAAVTSQPPPKKKGAAATNQPPPKKKGAAVTNQPPPKKKGAAVTKMPPPPKKGTAVKNTPPPIKKGAAVTKRPPPPKKGAPVKRPPPKKVASTPKTITVGTSPSFWSLQVAFTWKAPVVHKGDTIVFRWNSTYSPDPPHDVWLVDPVTYEGCQFPATIKAGVLPYRVSQVGTDVTYTYTVKDKPGTVLRFACGFSFHCDAGMKVMFNVE